MRAAIQAACRGTDHELRAAMRSLALLAIAACTSPTPGTTDDPAPDGGTVATSCAAAGKLTVFAIPPPITLDWSTPNKLLGSVMTSRTAAKAAVASGEAAITHSIGHVNIQLDCGDDSVPL